LAFVSDPTTTGLDAADALPKVPPFEETHVAV
jgi:hypothetical protein